MKSEGGVEAEARAIDVAPSIGPLANTIHHPRYHVTYQTIFKGIAGTILSMKSDLWDLLRLLYGALNARWHSHSLTNASNVLGTHTDRFSHAPLIAGEAMARLLALT